jgi:hypothetical protein
VPVPGNRTPLTVTERHVTGDQWGSSLELHLIGWLSDSSSTTHGRRRSINQVAYALIFKARSSHEKQSKWIILLAT